MQLVEIVDPRDAAPAVADFHEVDYRHHDRVAGREAAPLDPIVRHDLDLAVFDQAAFRGRTADVEREYVGHADEAPELRGSPEPARGSRLHHGDGYGAGALERVDAAVRLHDIQLPFETPRSKPVRETFQVTLGDRLYVSGEYRRVGALVLTPFARDLVRGYDRNFGPQIPNSRQHTQLVVGIRIRVQQAHGDRLDFLTTKVLDDRRKSTQLERFALLRQVSHPARELAAQIARHERCGLAIGQVEEIRPIPAGDLNGVAKARRGDERHLGALALGQRVDHDCRPMRDEIDRRDVHPGFGDHIEDASLEIRWRGVRLFRNHLLHAGFTVSTEIDEVRESATHIGGDTHDRG